MPLPSQHPIDRRQFLQLSALGAAGLAGATRLAPETSASSACRPGPGATPPSRRRWSTQAAQRRDRAHRPLADRRERQAGHAELDLQPRPTRARARGLRQPGQRGARRRRRALRQHHRAAPCRCRPIGWATTRAWVAVSSSRPTSSRPRSRPHRWSPPGIGTVTCPWSPTLTLNITKDWLPGCYLLKLVGDGGEEQFVPLTIRDDTSMASYVLQNSVTTWQAYNLWGSYSLYYGPDGKGRSALRQPRPGRVLRPPLPADLGLGSGRLRRQRVAAALPSREPRAGPHLLDRRRPARPARAPPEPSLPLQPGPRRVLVPTHAPGGVHGQRRRRQPRLPRRQRLLPPDPAAADLGRPQPPAGLLQGRQPRTPWLSKSPRSPRSTGTRPRRTTPSRHSSAPCTSRSAPRPTWWSPTRRRGSTTGATSSDGHTFPNVILGEYDRYVPSLPGPQNADVLAHSARPRAVQLVRHHLLHRAGQRRRRAGQRLGLLRVVARDHGSHPAQRHHRRHSRA